MDAPVCRLCGQKHWLNDEHVWPDEPKKVKSVVVHKPVLATIAPAVSYQPVVLATKDNMLATKHGKYADVDKRRKYQRDLMAKRRAS